MSDCDLIAAEVVRVPTGIGNCYIVGSSERWILVDSGTHGHANDIREAVAEHIGEDARPEAIVLTHGHFDHSGCARELAEDWNVGIYAHRMEFPFLNGKSAYPPPDPTVGGFMSQAIRLIPNKRMDVGDDNLHELSAGELPWLSGWEIIETPGHSPGHVSFFRREDGVLIAGDAFTSVDQNSMTDMLSQRQKVSSPPPYYTCDWQSAELSVKKLAELNPRVLAAGHGIPMRGAPATAQLRALAGNFPIPEHGRYVNKPAQTDENGIVYLPPAPADPVKMAGMIAAGVIAGAVAIGFVLSRRNQATERDIENRAA